MYSNIHSQLLFSLFVWLILFLTICLWLFKEYYSHAIHSLHLYNTGLVDLHFQYTHSSYRIYFFTHHLHLRPFMLSNTHTGNRNKLDPLGWIFLASFYFCLDIRPTLCTIFFFIMYKGILWTDFTITNVEKGINEKKLLSIIHALKLYLHQKYFYFW